MTKARTPYDTVVVSGGFDPVHIGHVRMILAASQYGDVIVVANSDSWLYRKKGFVFNFQYNENGKMQWMAIGPGANLLQAGLKTPALRFSIKARHVIVQNAIFFSKMDIPLKVSRSQV